MITMTKPMIADQWEATEGYKPCSSSKYKKHFITPRMGTKSILWLLLKRSEETSEMDNRAVGTDKVSLLPKWQLPVLSVYNDIKGGNIFKNKEYAYSSVLLHQRERKGEGKPEDRDKTETAALVHWKTEKGRHPKWRLTLRVCRLPPRLQNLQEAERTGNEKKYSQTKQVNSP